jgi:hypothetical protein
MTNHPDIAHFITRGYNLLVVVAVCYKYCTTLNAFINVVTYKGGTEALWLVKLIIINLRALVQLLWVIMYIKVFRAVQFILQTATTTNKQLLPVMKCAISG